MFSHVSVCLLRVYPLGLWSLVLSQWGVPQSGPITSNHTNIFFEWNTGTKSYLCSKKELSVFQSIPHKLSYQLGLKTAILTGDNRVFHNSSISAKFWQNPASIDREEQNKKDCSWWGLNPGTLDHHSDTLLTVLAWYVLGRRFLKRALFHVALHILDFDHF